MPRAAIVALFLAACTEHGQTPPGGGGDDPPPLPVTCQGHCIVEDPGEPTSDICCDSVTCYLDDETNEWVVTFCDPPLDPCFDCTPDQRCVQSFDGTCNVTTTCVEPVVDCPSPSSGACTTECEVAYCGAPLQCQNPAPCGTESPQAFHCYGP